VAVFLGFQWNMVVGPAGGGALFVAIFSTLMAGLLQFFIAYTVAMLAFWVLDVSTFIFTQFAIEYIASGHLFPLDLLPPWAHQLVMCTPYPYLLYLPAGIYLGRVSGGDMWQGLAIQLLWVGIGYGAARLVFARGIRKYSAVGG